MASWGVANARPYIFHDRRIRRSIDEEAMQLEHHKAFPKVRKPAAITPSKQISFITEDVMVSRSIWEIRYHRRQLTNCECQIFDGLGSAFLWYPRDTPTHAGILPKLTKKPREGSAHFKWGYHAALRGWTASLSINLNCSDRASHTRNRS